jgi:hypothetical protein
MAQSLQRGQKAQRSGSTGGGEGTGFPAGGNVDPLATRFCSSIWTDSKRFSNFSCSGNTRTTAVTVAEFGVAASSFGRLPVEGFIGVWKTVCVEFRDERGVIVVAGGKGARDEGDLHDEIDPGFRDGARDFRATSLLP